MLASEFINATFFGMIFANCGRYGSPTMENMQITYERMYIHLPCIYCKDGFNISVQVNNNSYCESENGVRTFGLNWLEVEWGFPSEPIDSEKFNAEEVDNTTNCVGGYVDVKLIDELCEQHGGFDLQATLSKGVDVLK